MHMSDRGGDTAAWLLASGFSSEHDTLQNWIFEGLLSVMSAVNRIENICGTDRDREHKAKARDRQKKGERGLQRKVGQWDRGVSDWTEECESVPGSAWFPHSVPAASSASHQLNKSHSHFDEINTHTHTHTHRRGWISRCNCSSLCEKLILRGVCALMGLKVCFLFSEGEIMLSSRITAQPSGRKKKSLREEEGSIQVRFFFFLSSPKWQSVGVFMI